MKIFINLLIFAIFFIVKTNAQPNCAAPSTGFTPINDLGTGISPLTGLMGGLYPNGSNFMPAAHKSAGLSMASQIQCLDTAGAPDPVNGKIVWLSIGMSNCKLKSDQFILQANAFSGKNPKLTLVNGGQSGQTSQIISSPWEVDYSIYWNTVNNRLDSENVSAQQVQVIWFLDANIAGITSVEDYQDSLVLQTKRVMNELKTRFPNVKICYLASRISARYASSPLNPEPYAYLTGWVVKKVIQDQINGDSLLAYSGSSVKSPWLSWGIYMWSDGSTPQATNPNIFYTCPADFQVDGTHPSVPIGAAKVGAFLLDFYSTDSTCTPWFLGTGCSLVSGLGKSENKNSILVSPNPFSSVATLKSSENLRNATLAIYNSYGQQITEMKNLSGNTVTLSRANLHNGLYFIRLTQDGEVITYDKIVIVD